jgi:hypothetical protein
MPRIGEIMRGIPQQDGAGLIKSAEMAKLVPIMTAAGTEHAPRIRPATELQTQLPDLHRGQRMRLPRGEAIER